MSLPLRIIANQLPLSGLNVNSVSFPDHSGTYVVEMYTCVRFHGYDLSGNADSFPRLGRIKCGSGIFISVMKTIDLLLGQGLRTLCETAQKALSDGPRIGDEVRAKHSLIAAKSLDSQGIGKMDTLLADIKHGRMTFSMELCDHDEQYAATCK